MKTTWKTWITIAAVLTALGGCAGMTTQQRNAAAGAALGGLTGSVLTGGDAFGTVGGAAIGGYIGSRVRP